MTILTALFVIIVFCGLALQLWLTARQAAHILSHQDVVPAAFASQISLAEHQKAASYSLARLGAERWDLILSSVVLFGWTLGGVVGLGTALYAVAIGPLTQQLLPWLTVPVRETATPRR